MTLPHGRTMLVHPSADFSTADVARGLFGALQRMGLSTAEYRLSMRLRYTTYGLTQLGVEMGLGPEPNPAMVAEHASEALVYRTVIEGCRWVLVVSGMSLHPNALAALHTLGVKIAVVYTESPYDTNEDGELRMIPVTDLAFTNERTSVSSFQSYLDAAGLQGRAYYLPHAYDPAIHNPTQSSGRHASQPTDVLFVGTGFANRQTLFEGVNWDGIDLGLGGMWIGVERYGPPHRLASYLRWGCIANEHTVELYKSTKIALNPHRWHETAESANPRAYELAACGVCQVSDDRAEIKEIFGDSVPTFPAGVPWRMETLVRDLLADPERRTRLAAEAMQRVQAHTFDDRARRVVEAMVTHDREVGMRAR